MPNKVTISDIAHALGLSRNTVSKALNGSAGIMSTTRQRVIDQAIRMNYKMMGQQTVPADEAHGHNVLLVCRDNQLINTFFGPLILELQQLVRNHGAVMTMQYMSPKEMADGVVPAQIYAADGVIGLEMLDTGYVQLLLKHNKPCVFFDCACGTEDFSEPFDVVLEDERSLYTLIGELIAKGMTKFGFVGDPEHCIGFRNRYDSFRLALESGGIRGHEDYSFLFRESETPDFVEMFAQRLKGHKLPEVFVCVNDHIAYSFYKALHRRGIRVPDQVQIITFGSSREATTQCEILSSVVTSRKGIASSISMLLFDRMENPDTPRRTVLTESHILRD